MSKYVPRFIKQSEETPKSAEVTEERPARRWGAELKPVVNTSLPAQLAPKLAPVTLAAATAGGVRELQPIRLGPVPKAVVTSMEDFPSLGVKTFKATPINPSVSFAALSRDWAKKQSEEELKAKEEAANEAMLRNEQQKLREKEERDLRKAGIIAIPQLRSRQADEEDELLKQKEKNHLSDDEESDNCMEDNFEEDEGEEYECDGVWDSRKHRDELY